MSIVAGIDLAGSYRRPTGIAFLKNWQVIRVKEVYLDEDIISEIRDMRPKLIGIDAPLTLPRGRRGVEDREGPKFRLCDLELRERGIKFFPVTLGPMRSLTLRGIMLKEKLEKLNYQVVEVYPGATQDILGIPRKSRGLSLLREGLRRLGVRGVREDLSGDELDAITAAITVQLYLEGKAEFIGDPTEGLILIPKG